MDFIVTENRNYVDQQNVKRRVLFLSSQIKIDLVGDKQRVRVKGTHVEAQVGHMALEGTTAVQLCYFFVSIVTSMQICIKIYSTSNNLKKKCQYCVLRENYTMFLVMNPILSDLVILCRLGL